MSDKYKIFVSAGDPSADSHAARLMREIKKIAPNAEFAGVGGERMKAVGMDILADHEQTAVVGFWEVAKRYSYFKKLLKRCSEYLKRPEVKLFLPIDYPGFNLSLAKSAKEIGKPSIYYIAPQLWAWGIGRAKKLADRINKALVVFPFEEKFFADFGLDAKFVGHPFFDDPDFPDEFKAYEEREKKIAFFPGSRKQELSKHLPLVAETIKILEKRLPDFSFAIAKSPSLPKEYYEKYFGDSDGPELNENGRDLLKNSLVGAIKTGTSNLEACFCGIPFAMFYKTSPLSYFIGKNLVKSQFLSIVNILEKREVVKELIQRDASPKKISAEIVRLVEERDTYESLQKRFAEIRDGLGVSGAAETAAKAIVAFIENHAP